MMELLVRLLGFLLFNFLFMPVRQFCMSNRPKISAVDAPGPRSSGLTPVPEVRWGGHLSVFFATAEDLFEIVANYFQAGLSGNESCLWVTSDPFPIDEALKRLAELIPNFDRYVADGAVELTAGAQWYLTNDELDIERVTRMWFQRTDAAVRAGFTGLRVVGNAFWLQNKYWDKFSDYEDQLSDQVRGRRIILLCIYPLHEASASDVLDVTKAHDFSIALRNGSWEFLESPDLVIARREIHRLQNALDILSLPFPGRAELTPRERLTLAQIVRGASNKEAARALKISPRTVEFHRGNIMRKLDVHNLAELMSLVLSGVEARRRRAPTTGRA
jgi:DNA-binding CsgD family transcriptional regulator